MLVDENAFENDAKEKKQKEKQEEDKKNLKDDKTKTGGMFLSWLLYDEWSGARKRTEDSLCLAVTVGYDC